MLQNISYWVKGDFSDDQHKNWIYIVPSHGANPPLDRSEWVPVSVTYDDRPYERFLEECRIQGYTFLKESEIEEVTGQRQMRNFGIQIYVIKHDDGRYYNIRYGWMNTVSNCSRFTGEEIEHFTLPANSHWDRRC